MACFLYQGSTGSKVRELQDKLKKIGYYTRQVDGSYGPYTTSAVKSYQRAKGLVIDGCVGNQTWGSLFSSPVVPVPSNACPDNQLKQGCVGPNVADLQIWLGKNGFYDGKIDGEFGPVTDSAVRTFQSKAGIVVDGWVGAETRKAMASYRIPIVTQPTESGIYIETSWTNYDQTTSYTCGPTSSMMALSSLGVYASEMELAAHEGTTTAGTDHSGIRNGCINEAREHGVNITVYEKSFSEIGWKGLGEIISDPNQSVIAHGNTAGWRRFYTGTYGHYVFIVGVNLVNGTVTVADPARDATLVYPMAEFKAGLDLVSQKSFIILKKI